MKVKINDGYVTIDGKKTFITSGEVQYFRLEKSKWKKIIHRLKEAKCNTLSTYIPWNWHEYREGAFDFTGETHPSRDLVSFLNLVKENNLYAILKIGPHIHAEFKNGGIPLYLIEKHPTILSLDANGKPTSTYAFYPPITYLHPIYMDYVNKWYKEVLTILLSYDNILFLQIDNEVSYNISFFGYGSNQAFTGDYNPFIVKDGLYQKFLKQKYTDINVLNKKYDEKNRGFSEIIPPQKEPKTMNQHQKVTDWIEFREKLAADYMRQLIENAYKLGCRLPFVINDPLLGYTTSWESIYDTLKDTRWQVIISYTIYHGNIQEENISSQITKLEFTRASNTPLVLNMEIQSCDAYFLNHWKQNQSDYNLLWKMAIAYGVNGMNYYWFADGINFNGYEYFLPKLKFNSPVTENGEKNFQFPILKKLNSMLEKHPEIVATEPVYDISIGFYHLYSMMLKFNNKLNVNNFELGPSNNSTGSFVDLMSVCNIRFQLINIEDNFEEKLKTDRLIFISNNFLNKEIQKKLLQYVTNGGNLILIGKVPVYDENLNECKILFDALKIKKIEMFNKPSGFFETEKVIYNDYILPVFDDIETYQTKNNKSINIDVRLLKNNKIAGFTEKIGKGKISVLGFTPRVFLDISRKFARDYFHKESEDKILIYERKKGKISFFTIFNLYERKINYNFRGLQLILPPRDAIFILKEGEKYNRL